MPSKFTYDEVKEEFNKKGYTLISNKYNKISEKLEYICLKHREKGIQKIDYAHLKRGQGCKYCGYENKKSGKEKELYEYNAKELTESKGFEFVDFKRENGKLCIYYICPRHRDDGIQKTSLVSMRKNKIGCPHCVGRGKTHEEFLLEVKAINPNIEILGRYEKANKKILCKCTIDNTEWLIKPNNLLNGQGCPTCGRRKNSDTKRKTAEEFKSKLNIINNDITVIGHYSGVKEKIDVKCNICGCQWTTTPNSLLHEKSKCPRCVAEKQYKNQAKTNEQFLNELKIVNPNIIPLEPYYNDKSKILVKCNIHDYLWKVTPNKILHKQIGCPMCAMYTGEYEIDKFLTSLKIKHILQYRFDDCKDKYTLPFDFYLPDYNTCIEYDGEQHYRPVNFGGVSNEEAQRNFEITQKHDKIKTEYCKQHKINLIRIPYFEKNNIDDILHKELKIYN